MGASAAVAFTFLGAGIAAQGHQRAGQAKQDIANYNANVSELQAEDALARGKIAETKHRAGTRKLLGAQRAGSAAAGVVVDDPDSTVANIQADTAHLSELDALTIRTNAAREAWGFRTQARHQVAAGQIAADEGDMRAIGEITSAASSVFGAKYGFGRR